MTESMRSRRGPLFIMGCQRSGTTLLALVLHSHSEIEVIDEDDFRFHSVHGATLLLDFDQVLQGDPSKMPYRIFKAPRDSHRTRELFALSPGARILWSRRPVEQVVASMCSLHLGRESWALSHAPREIKKYIETFPDDHSVAAAFDEYSATPGEHQREVLLAALCWVCKDKCRAYVQSENATALHCVNYLDLVRKPEATTRRLCGFIGVNWEPALLHHHEIHHGWRIGATLAHRAIDTVSIDKWKHTLSTDDLALIDAVLARLETGDPVATSFLR